MPHCINDGEEMYKMQEGSWVSEYYCPKCKTKYRFINQDLMSGTNVEIVIEKFVNEGGSDARGN